MKKLIFAAAVLGTMFVGSSRASAQVVSGRVNLPGISIGVNDGPYYRYGHHHRPRYYAYGGGYYVPQQGYMYAPDGPYGQSYGQQGACQSQYPQDSYQERGNVRPGYGYDNRDRDDRYENQTDQGYNDRGNEQQQYERERNYQQGQGYEQQQEYEQPQEGQGYNEQGQNYDDGYDGR